MANYLYVCELSGMFLCLLFVMWQLIMWSSSTYVFSAHIFNNCVTTSPHVQVNSIVYCLPIDYGQFKPLVDIFDYLLAIFCSHDFSQNSVNFKSALECAVIAATNVLSQYSITMKHEIFNLIIMLQFTELWKSLRMAILASLQLFTSAAS